MFGFESTYDTALHVRRTYCHVNISETSAKAAIAPKLRNTLSGDIALEAFLNMHKAGIWGRGTWKGSQDGIVRAGIFDIRNEKTVASTRLSWRIEQCYRYVSKEILVKAMLDFTHGFRHLWIEGISMDGGNSHGIFHTSHR